MVDGAENGEGVGGGFVLEEGVRRWVRRANVLGVQEYPRHDVEGGGGREGGAGKAGGELSGRRAQGWRGGEPGGGRGQVLWRWGSRGRCRGRKWMGDQTVHGIV